jgi:hypothetical protein
MCDATRVPEQGKSKRWNQVVTSSEPTDDMHAPSDSAYQTDSDGGHLFLSITNHNSIVSFGGQRGRCRLARDA